MRIFDENQQEITQPDLSLGYLRQDRILVAHHEAVAAVEEQWHYETVAQYPNGGRDVARVVDVPGVAPREAWDEYEDILRYVPYTQQQLEEMAAQQAQPTRDERLQELEEALELLLTGVSQ